MGFRNRDCEWLEMPTETGVHHTGLLLGNSPDCEVAREQLRLLPPSRPTAPRPPCNQLRSFWSRPRPHPSTRQDTTTEEAGETGEVLKGSTHTPASSFPSLVEKHLPRGVGTPRLGRHRWLGLWGLVEEGSGSGCGRSQWRAGGYGRGRRGRGLGSGRG